MASLPDHRRTLAGLIATVVVAVIATLSVVSLLPPSPVGTDAPATDFSAERAFRHVETVARDVHVTGSAAADDVQQYIVSELAAVGIDANVQEGIGAVDALGRPAMAHISNVVATVPGTDPTGPIILMAHYDSVQVSHGANDDGSGVAVLLETARALQAASALRNDIILLFTDAEEACLCGAEAFVNSYPLAQGEGVVLNFEARGSSGPPVMFETSTNNAAIVAHYAAAVPYPVATSMAVEVYRILPNDTDFTPFLQAGRFIGLNSAYIDGVAAYHTPQDDIEHFSQATLQAHGANALALAKQLGDADISQLLDNSSGDATYFPVFGTLVSYSGALVVPLAFITALALLSLFYVARSRTNLSVLRLAAGSLVMVVPLIGAAVLAQLFRSFLVWLRPGYTAMVDPWSPGWFRAAVCALVAVVGIGWYALLRRRIGAVALHIGALTWLTVIGLAMTFVTPGGAYLSIVPALAGIIAAGVGVFRPGGTWHLIASTIAGAIAAVILAPAVLLFFPALGLATGAAAAVIAAMLLLVCLPVIDYLHPSINPETTTGDKHQYAARTRFPAGIIPTSVVAVAAIVLTIAGLGANRFTAQQPQPTQLMYAMDADTGAAYWLTEQKTAGEWLSHYVSEPVNLEAKYPLLTKSLLSGPAAIADLPPPHVTVTSDSVTGQTRTVILQVTSQRTTRLLNVATSHTTVLSASVRVGQSERIVELVDDELDLLFHAAPLDGVELVLTLPAASPMTLRVIDGSDGLADLPGFVARPADIGIQGSHTSELVIVATTVTIP